MAIQAPIHPDVALNLALAVIASSEAPLLLLDGGLAVIAASTSFCRSFAVNILDVEGKVIFDLGNGEWNTARLKSLLSATTSGQAQIDAYEIDLKCKGADTRRLVLRAQKLEYGSPDQVRILLTISDVTDARASERLKDQLVQEKTVLLQEVQHRVANSLQIIASVLLQSARKVNSDESRGHLHDAHNRIMSIAAVQKQLADTSGGSVELRPYFTQLCQSIGASMIGDHKQISLEVESDERKVSANESVSLGLVVTELVINALKHAFPIGRKGVVRVGYQTRGLDWTLSVADDGVGMPDGPLAKAGLGTSIVEALAHQLQAEVTLTRLTPGTAIALAHSQISAMNSIGAQRSVSTAL